MRLLAGAFPATPSEPALIFGHDAAMEQQHIKDSTFRACAAQIRHLGAGRDRYGLMPVLTTPSWSPSCCP